MRLIHDHETDIGETELPSERVVLDDLRRREDDLRGIPLFGTHLRTDGAGEEHELVFREIDVFAECLLVLLHEGFGGCEDEHFALRVLRQAVHRERRLREDGLLIAPRSDLPLEELRR